MNAAAHTLDASTPTTLVYGLGGTGLSLARYFKRRGERVAFLDSREEPPGMAELRAVMPDAEVTLGEFDEAALSGVSRVVVSPGIPDHDPILGRLRETGVELLSDVDLFVEQCEAPFVAITGSNGKSTVTTLVERMCQCADVNALAGGNLGRPALDLLAEETPAFYVLELSSFQLQRTRQLPAEVAVLLNISPDHLDWHRDEAEYRAAKQRIYDEATHAVFNRDDNATTPPDGKTRDRLSFGMGEAPDKEFGLLAVDGEEYLAVGDEALMPVAEIALVGRHNYANALAALAVGTLIGLPMAPMLETLRQFGGLEHRMQFVRELNGVRYINDSKATNVGAAIAAVLSVEGPVVLLAGGQGKGGDFDALADAISSKLKAIVVFGEDADKLEHAFQGKAEVIPVPDMAEALAVAHSRAAAGDTVLLAPACASFDQFKNFPARGDAFCKQVMELPQ